ncbi:MAG: TlpA disulfide reductase family protein [Bacteroidota bacterium]
MNKKILFCIFSFFSLPAFPQNDAVNIIQKSLSSSSQIRNGTYDARLRIKYLTGTDTALINGTCRFHRYAPDTLEGAKFDLSANNVRVLYDDRNKTTIYSKDSFAVVHDKWKFNLKFSGTIFRLLSGYFVNGRMDIDVVIKSPQIKIQLMKDTIIDNKSCYHITLHPDDDETSQNIYRQLYITKEKYFLIGEVLNLDSRNHHQFTELFLQNVKININGLDGNYGVNLIPEGFFVKNYVPDELSKLLSKGTPAPAFSLTDLEGKNISLQTLKGKIVVLYFWNAIDQQSRVRLMPLQKIYNKHNGNGVEVLGMNVNDRNKQHLKKFLQGKKITFPHLLDAAITGEKYNLLNLPTIYVIGKDEKIIEGFTPVAKENLEIKLENLIQKNQ